jgi:hypothetical protein
VEEDGKSKLVSWSWKDERQKRRSRQWREESEYTDVSKKKLEDGMVVG